MITFDVLMPYLRRTRHAAALVLVTAAGACQAITGISELEVGEPDGTTGGGPPTAASSSTITSSTSTSTGDGGAASTSTGQGGGSTSPSGGGTGDGGHGGSQGGAGGGEAECLRAEDCDPVVCATTTCDDGRCGSEAVDPGTDCEGGFCDEDGICRRLCGTNENCADLETDCALYECNADFACEMVPLGAGLACEGETGFCDGDGSCVECINDGPCVDEPCRDSTGCDLDQNVCTFTNVATDAACIVGVGFCNGAQECVECTTRAHCADGDGDLDDCLVPACGDEECQGSDPVNEGIPCTDDGVVDGVCDGDGTCVECTQDAHCDADVCDVVTCDQLANECESDPEAAGEPCTGGVCDGDGACIECLETDDCADQQFCATDPEGVNDCVACDAPPPAANCPNDPGLCSTPCSDGLCLVQCPGHARCGATTVALDTRPFRTVLTCEMGGCSNRTVSCAGPPGELGGPHDCTVNCMMDGCNNTVIDCTRFDGRCIVNCSSPAACANLRVECGDNACEVNCGQATGSVVNCNDTCSCEASTPSCATVNDPP